MPEKYHRNGRKVRSDKGAPRPLTAHQEAAIKYKNRTGVSFAQALKAVAKK